MSAYHALQALSISATRYCIYITIVVDGLRLPEGRVTAQNSYA